MLAAFRELTSGPQARQRFRQAVREAPNDGEQRAALVKRIERMGKGRFAQRLGAHLDEVAPPKYIAAAIERIADTVSS
jgi:hypothetical protein